MINEIINNEIFPKSIDKIVIEDNDISLSFVYYNNNSKFNSDVILIAEKSINILTTLYLVSIREYVLEITINNITCELHSLYKNLLDDLKNNYMDSDGLLTITLQLT